MPDHIEMKLILDSWSEGRDLGSVIDNPKLSAVMDAIDALDCAHRTIVSLSSGEFGLLMIAGPCGGGYIVNGTLNGHDFYSPKNTEAGPEKVSCFIGGQDGDYRAEQFVSRQIAE